jgi:hypothetical protein
MVKLHAGNCVLKPSQRRQLQSWLRRAIHLGERVGNFVLTITVRRVGHIFAMQANVSDSAGGFDCRCKGQTWRDVCRAMVRMLSSRLHDQRLRLAAGI